jgi:peptide/nickel transport system ATP-binding protein
VVTTPLLSATNADIGYGKRGGLAVLGASLVVRPGEAVGIVGESGSGKTTLARALVGLIRPTAGSVAVCGRDWRTIKWRDPLRRSVQMIFQDPYASLNPVLTALEAVAEAIQVTQRIRRGAASGDAVRLLADVGLDASMHGRRPSQLSGGQCQRVSVARALACSPAVLVADEPTSALDVSVQAQLLRTLNHLRQARGMALVLISHDFAVVRQLTDRVCVMHAGKIVEEGPVETILATPRASYTKELLAAVPERWKAPSGAAAPPKLSPTEEAHI